MIDGGEVYFAKEKIKFDEKEYSFSHYLDNDLMDNLFIKKQPTLEELIAIKPRLCWVLDYDGEEKSIIEIVEKNKYYYNRRGTLWKHAQMLTDDEIKQFLNGE